jgi:hypothetical protein
MVKISSPAKTPKLAQPKTAATTKPATKNKRNAGAKRKPAGLTFGQMDDDVHLEQAATLLAMFREHAERFKKEPMTQKLAGLAHAYWSEYPMWLEAMGLPESKQRDPQLIYKAMSALDHAHKKAMVVLLKFAALRGLDLPSIEYAAKFCREAYRDDFERCSSHREHREHCDKWPESLGAVWLKLPADIRQAIETTTATLQKIHVSEFVAGSQTAFVAAKTLRESSTHAPDFRSVNWFGTVYEFTPNQAACVKVLWEAWDNGTPIVGDATILESAGSDAERLPLVFRDHPAWMTLIVGVGTRRGVHRLADPPAA